MSGGEPCLSILVLTEDSAGDAHTTVTTLAKKMLLLVDEACRTHRIDFRPLEGREAEVMHGNLWKSENPRDRSKIVLLGRRIAAKLLERDGADHHCYGFVLFHVDGDRTWTDRDTSENVTKFGSFVASYVSPALDAALLRALPAEGRAPDDLDATRTAALERLCRLVPFYSIEAWLYQNTSIAREICAASCGAHADLFNTWEADRGLLDEELKPKRDDLTCLRSRHNVTLAGAGFPAEKVYLADKSYRAAVDLLMECDDLCAALARTHA